MKHDLIITQTGYGHWRIGTIHYRKLISTITTNSRAIDNYNSDPDEKDGKKLRKLGGYKRLRMEIIQANKH